MPSRNELIQALDIIHREYLQLCNECSNPNSLIWNHFIGKLNEERHLVFKNMFMIKPTIAFARLKGAYHFKDISEFRLLHSIRYGDMSFYGIAGHLKSISNNSMNTKAWILHIIRDHLLLVAQSLLGAASDYDYKQRNVGTPVIRLDSCALHTVLVIESMQSLNVMRGDYDPSIFYAVSSLFLSLCLFRKLWSKNGEISNCLGCLMVYGAQYIAHFLRGCTVSQLRSMMLLVVEEHKEFFFKNCDVDITAICVEMKAWQFNVVQAGSMVHSEISFKDRFMANCYSLMLLGKWSMNGKDYPCAMKMFVDSICNSVSIYSFCLSSRYLSEVCVRVGQYVIALRLLNVAYKFCTMYEFTITPTFVNVIYAKKRKKIKKKLKRLFCSHCGKKGKLQCCTGCMTAVYCSKSCQKRHWSLDHKKQCNREWFEFYEKLKDYFIFF